MTGVIEAHGHLTPALTYTVPAQCLSEVQALDWIPDLFDPSAQFLRALCNLIGHSNEICTVSPGIHTVKVILFA